MVLWRRLPLFALEARAVDFHLAPLGTTVLLPVIFFVASAINKRSGLVWKAVIPLIILLDIWVPYHTVYSNPQYRPAISSRE